MLGMSALRAATSVPVNAPLRANCTPSGQYDTTESLLDTVSRMTPSTSDSAAIVPPAIRKLSAPTRCAPRTPGDKPPASWCEDHRARNSARKIEWSASHGRERSASAADKPHGKRGDVMAYAQPFPNGPKLTIPSRRRRLPRAR
jgi:hypothetical protein